MKRHLLNIAFNPFFQALVVAVLVILFFPRGIKKYQIRQMDMVVSFEQSRFFFADLDHDGYSERIHTFFNDAGNVGVVFRTKHQPDRQYNFRGIYQPKTTRMITGDYNQNGTDEVYLFTLVHDSLILHGFEFGKTLRNFLSNRHIATIGKNLKDPDFMILPGMVKDFNGDGYGELTFAINAGFSRQPRKVFMYDIRNDSLVSSPESGAFISSILLHDLDKDGIEEILLKTYASDNYNEDSVPYHDSCSWLMILDRNLDFIFPPKRFPGITGNISVSSLQSGNRSLVLAEAFYYPNDILVKDLLLYDIHGNLIDSARFGQDEPFFEAELISQNPQDRKRGTIFAKGWTKGIYTIDSNLQVREISTQESSMREFSFVDIDGDARDEIILLKPDKQKHLILRDNLKDAVELDIPIQSTVPLYSVRIEGANPPQLSVQGDQVWKLFEYRANPVYRFRLVLYVMIYLVIFGFIMLIRKLYYFQIKKRHETERRIASLQLSAVKAQMDPHFIFNVINSISSSIYQERKDQAYMMILKFSNMVRDLLSTSDQLAHSLQDEIEFVTNYLELQKMRFPGLFEYQVDMDADISRNFLIPKMIIQLHVENALKHGIMPKEKDGSIGIKIVKEEGNLVITVTDNGIGRKNSLLVNSSSTGKGMIILRKIFEIYNKYNRQPMKQEITDLVDQDGSPAGTKVMLWVPLEFNEKIY